MTDAERWRAVNAFADLVELGHRERVAEWRRRCRSHVRWRIAFAVMASYSTAATAWWLVVTGSWSAAALHAVSGVVVGGALIHNARALRLARATLAQLEEGAAWYYEHRHRSD